MRRRRARWERRAVRNALFVDDVSDCGYWCEYWCDGSGLAGIEGTAAVNGIE